MNAFIFTMSIALLAISVSHYSTGGSFPRWMFGVGLLALSVVIFSTCILATNPLELAIPAFVALLGAISGFKLVYRDVDDWLYFRKRSKK